MPAFAQSAPQPAAPSGSAPLQCPSAAQWTQAPVGQLAQWADACEDNAFFHAYLGAKLLALGQTEAAAVSLEKALLLNPDLPGAQICFAQALAQIGLKGFAKAIPNDVPQMTDLTNHLKNQLARAKFVPAQTSWQGRSLAQTH